MYVTTDPEGERWGHAREGDSYSLSREHDTQRSCRSGSISGINKNRSTSQYFQVNCRTSQTKRSYSLKNIYIAEKYAQNVEKKYTAKLSLKSESKMESKIDIFQQTSYH